MRITYIELAGKKHPLCFSLAASEELDEYFGGLSNMQAELGCGDIGRIIRAADKVLQVLLRAGRVYVGACGEELPPELPCRPADLIDVTGDAMGAIFAAIRNDTEREVEAATKNAEATPAQ